MKLSPYLSEFTNKWRCSTFYSILLCIFCCTHVWEPEVKLTHEIWGDIGCYNIEMTMERVYFEKKNGTSCFKSFNDKESNNWIASHMHPEPKPDN